MAEVHRNSRTWKGYLSQMFPHNQALNRFRKGLQHKMKTLILILLLCCAAYSQPRILTQPNSGEAIAVVSPTLVALPTALEPDARVMIFCEGIDNDHISIT